jgi:hypothetical protein
MNKEVIIVYFSEGEAHLAERVPSTSVDDIRKGYSIGCDTYGGGSFLIYIWDEENNCFIDDDPIFGLSEEETKNGIKEVTEFLKSHQ